MAFKACEFSICCSIVDLVDEVNEQQRPDPELAELLSGARIELHLVDLCNYYPRLREISYSQRLLNNPVLANGKLLG